jgi:hypothetical protein
VPPARCSGNRMPVTRREALFRGHRIRVVFHRVLVEFSGGRTVPRRSHFESPAGAGGMQPAVPAKRPARCVAAPAFSEHATASQTELFAALARALFTALVLTATATSAATAAATATALFAWHFVLPLRSLLSMGSPTRPKLQTGAALQNQANSVGPGLFFMYMNGGCFPRSGYTSRLA